MKTVILNKDTSAIMFPLGEQKLGTPCITWAPFSQISIQMGSIRLVKSWQDTDWFIVAESGDQYGPFNYRTIIAFLSTQEDSLKFIGEPTQIIAFETLKSELYRTLHYAPSLNNETLSTSNVQRGIIGGITLSPGNFCSAECSYCYARSRFNTPQAEQTSLKVLEGTFELIRNNPLVRRGCGITMGGGGDPTENFNVYLQAVELSKRYRNKYGLTIPVYIATQEPSFIKEEMIDAILENQDWITLSIDGDMDEEYHRPRSEWIRIVQKYRSRVKWAASAVFTARTVSRIKHNYEYLMDAGFEAIQIRPVRLPSNHPLALKKEDYQTAVAQYRDLFQLLLKEDKLPDFFSRLTSADTLGHFMLRYLTEIGLRSRCSAGGGGGCGALFINSTGQIYPCPSMAIECVKLGEVQSGAIDMATLEKLHDLPSKCQRCPIRSVCGGPCSYESMLATGTPYSLDPVICRFQRSVAALTQDCLHDLYATHPGVLVLMLSRFAYRALGLKGWQAGLDGGAY